jgi:signal transduction histidine kinase/DNA-binding response OmpR family regulator
VNAGPSPARRLTVLYITALSLVALLLVTGQWLVQWSIGRQLSDSRVINIAGRQRMLSQQISKLVLQIQRDGLSTARGQELSEALDAWQTAHRGLRSGDAELGLPGENTADVAAMFDGLEPHFAAMSQAVDALLAADPGTDVEPYVHDVMSREPAFLSGMDRIVDQYEAEAHDRVAALQLMESIILAVTLGVLAVEGLFIFRPAAQQIRSYVAQLRTTNEQLLETKQQADAANMAKTQFLANMSHELRTPMNAILGLTDLLQRTQMDERQERLLETVHNSASSLMTLLDDLLDVARIEDGGPVAIEHRWFSPGVLVEELVTLFTPQAAKKNLRLVHRVDEAVPASTLGDPERLRQVLANLLQNAIKFTETGQVTLTAVAPADTSGQELIFTVADSGVGIPEELQTQVFERFTQVDQSLSRRVGGIGLGLHICSRLIQAMGGSISLESRVGVGSRFRVRIPIASGSPIQSSPERPTQTPSHATKPLRILVVEDNPANQLLMSEYLAELGHDCRIASDGESAIPLATRADVDVVFMDVEMPGMDGLSATLAIRRDEAGCERSPKPIIAMTAHAREEDRRMCLDSGMTDYLAKPVSIDDLARILSQIPPSLAERSAPVTDSVDAFLEHAHKRFAGRERILKKLLALFVEELPAIQQELKQALANDDGKALAFWAHRVRGTLANLGDEIGARIAGDLEHLAHHEGPSTSARQRGDDLLNHLVALQKSLSSIEGLETSAPSSH